MDPTPDTTPPRTWVVDTAEVLRRLPYLSPVAGWHSHGMHLVPSDGCAACTELRRRSEGPDLIEPR